MILCIENLWHDGSLAPNKKLQVDPFFTVDMIDTGNRFRLTVIVNMSLS